LNVSSIVNSNVDNVATFLAPKQLERYTRYLPWNENETILYSNDQNEELRRFVEPFKRNMLKETMTDDNLETMNELLHKFFAYTQTNDAKLFPAKPPNLRKDVYKKTWTDFYTFAQVCASTPQHCKVVILMEKLFPEACGIIPPPPTAQPPTQQGSDISSSTGTLGLQGVLLNSTELPKAKLIKSEALADFGADIWNQYEQCRKQMEEDELKAEREKQMANTTPAPQSPLTDNSAKSRKRKSIDSTSAYGSFSKKKSKTNHEGSLFALYWTAQAKQQKPAIVFDGQKEDNK